MDKGNILNQEIYLIDRNCTFDTLLNELSNLGGNLLCQTLLDLQKFRENSKSQSEYLHFIQTIYERYNKKGIDCDMNEIIDINDLKDDYFKNRMNRKEINNETELQLQHTEKIPKDWSYIDWNLSPDDIFNRWRAVKGLVCFELFCFDNYL